MTDLNLQIGDTVQCKNGQLTTVADIRQGAKTTVSLADFTGFHDLNGLYNGSAHHSYDISRNLSEEQRQARPKTFNAFEPGDVVYLRNGARTTVRDVGKGWISLSGYAGSHQSSGRYYVSEKESPYDIVHNETAGERLKAMLPAKPALEFKNDDRVELRNGTISTVWRVDDVGVKLCDFHAIHNCDGTYPMEWQKKFDIVRNLSLEERQAATAPAAVINHLSREDVDAFREDRTLDQYQQIATKSAIYPGKGTPFGLMYVALGLAEAGEVQNKVKKMFRDDGVLTFIGEPEGETGGYHATQMVRFGQIEPERRNQLIKELGGALWYISATCNELGIKLSDVAYKNLDELCGRTERDTLRGDGDDR